jgi:rubrerythrin
MPHLAESRTIDHLRHAYAALAATTLRHRRFAQRAEEEGNAEVAALHRALADDAEGRAFEAIDHLAPGASTEDDLKVAIEGATRAYTERLPEFADVARSEGFDELASWFEHAERAAKASAARLTQGLETVD